MQWYLTVLKNYVGFEGRARRMEYWMFVLVSFIISFLLSMIEVAGGFAPVLSTLYALFIFLPSLAVTVRRLHDTGRSGLWILLIFIPLIGPIVLLVFTCLEGQPYDNDYGANPKTNGNF